MFRTKMGIITQVIHGGEVYRWTTIILKVGFGVAVGSDWVTVENKALPAEAGRRLGDMMVFVDSELGP